MGLDGCVILVWGHWPHGGFAAHRRVELCLALGVSELCPSMWGRVALGRQVRKLDSASFCSLFLLM